MIKENKKEKKSLPCLVYTWSCSLFTYSLTFKQHFIKIMLPFQKIVGLEEFCLEANLS